MAKELREVRILMLGESGVGKTSLILSLVSEQFIDQDDTFELPAKLESIYIPPNVTLENVPGVIIDYSSREQSNDELITEIKRASVICLVYAMNDENSKTKISSYWLPKIYEIQDLEYKKPILLIGNKCDITELNIIQDQFISKLVAEYSEIETCIECSAKSFKNVPEVFYYAQKSVLYPTLPVYNNDLKQLTPLCCKCLTRIFKLCDHDNDGVLNDNELNEFQYKCFGINLAFNALQEVKNVVKKKINDGLIKNNLTLKGFLCLNELFIEKGRHETTWTILKKFGYDRYLGLAKDYAYPTLKISPNCSTELNQKGFEYLNYLFQKHDKDKDMCLNKNELEDLFSVCPVCPWGNDVYNTIQTNERGYITFEGFLSQWALTTYLDVSKSMQLLAYLGYNNYYQESQKNALIINRPKEVDIEKKHTYRNCFLCYVYGRKKSGKTAFLQGLLGRDLQYQLLISPEDQSRWSCNLIRVHNSETFLILKEINSSSDIDLHETYPPDIVALLYDLTDPNSFSFVADIFLSAYNEKPTPCVLIGTKYDQTKIEQNYPITPELFAKQYNLPPPQYFSASNVYLSDTDIYTKLTAIAINPKLYPMKSNFWRLFQNFVNNITRTRTSRHILSAASSLNKNNSNSYKDNLIPYSLVFAACLALSFVIMKFIK